jgi:histone-lysine N-methyltransferase SETD1
LYSLLPLPPWPPARSEYPSEKRFKILFDSAIDKDRDLKFALLMDKVQEAGTANTRVKTKGGKEILMRFGGEVVHGEPELVLADPRKVRGFKKTVSLWPFRAELYEIEYEVRDGFLPYF